MLPAYSGSVWRGLFGHGLRRTVCVTRQPACAGCLLLHTCAYPYLFETPVPADAAKLSRYPHAPHPFVLVPEDITARTIEPGASCAIILTLFGRANALLPYIVQSFIFAGELGIGRSQAKFRVDAIDQEATPGAANWTGIHRSGGSLAALPPAIPEPPPAPDAIRIALRTPLRVKRDDHLVGPGEFAFHDFYRSLLRRLSLLCYFHGEHPLDLDFRELVEEARNIPIEDSELCWNDWTRYSSRQRTTMQMGGLMGRFTVRPSARFWPQFWRQLWLGQWTHASKGSSMGLGQYRVDDASLPIGTLAP
jgi:hypothetical protein